MIWLALAITAFAAAVDLRRREIPDWCPVLLVGAALAHGILATASGAAIDVDWTSRLLGGGVAFGIGAALFYAGGFGGGDAKLLGALGFALGAGETWTLLFWTALGGAVAGVVAARRGDDEVPYGPAIAVGVALTIVARHWPLLAPFS